MSRRKIVAIPGGMESDLSDSDIDISDVIAVPAEAVKNSTSVSYHASEEKDKRTQIQPQNVVNNNASHLGSGFNSRGFNRFRPQNRNQHRPSRRQCFDTKSSQILDDVRYAIMSNNIETVKNIYSKDIWVDTILKSDWTGLMYACSFGHSEIVAYLLEKKSNPNYHKDGFTSLMAVCVSKKSEEDLLKCCSLLLQSGAKVNAYEKHRTTPLMFAARDGHLSIVKSLLDHGADPDIQDNRGKTALALAVSNGYGKVTRLLLESGADVKILNDMGQSPIDIAHEAGYKEIASVLEKRSSGENLPENSMDPIAKDFQKNDVSKFARNSSSKQFVRVGELELFLSGEGLQDLIPRFVEHQLSLHDLLVMDEDELEKIGISQVGARKKILDACKAVHKKQWENTSLPNLKQRQYISCPDAVAMMANIAKHMKYISSSVIYIRQQIQSQPRILEIAQDSANVHDLLDEIEDGLKNIRFLNDELRFFKMHLEKVQDQVQYIPADLLVEIKPLNRKRSRIYIFVGIATSAGIACYMWKTPSALFRLSLLASSLTNYIQRTFQLKT